MTNGGANRWKIFGIVMIAILGAAAIGLAAFFIGRGCEEKDKATTTPTTRTQTQTSPAPAGGVAPAEAGGEAGGEPAPPDGTGAPTETTTGTTTERYVIGEGEGETPCTGGFKTITRTTYWSDGSTDTTTTTVPCP